MLNHHPQEDFTLPELEIVSLIQQGFTSQEIAQQLHISAFTIKKHRENIARKIGSHGKKNYQQTNMKTNLLHVIICAINLIPLSQFDTLAQKITYPVIFDPQFDSIHSTLLKEVKVRGKKIVAFETEKPSRKKHYSFLTKYPTQIGMIFNEEQIVGKKLNYISIYFDQKFTPTYIFQILLFTVGKDTLPSTLLNKRELVYSANHEGWTKFNIQTNDISIPKEGIAVVINFFNKSNVITGETDRIAMAKYTRKRRFFFRPTSQNNWIIFNYFQEGRIGPMIRISVDDE